MSEESATLAFVPRGPVPFGVQLEKLATPAMHPWIAAFVGLNALLIFGSGRVRGLGVVLWLGILSSMFSAVLVSRGFVILI